MPITINSPYSGNPVKVREQDIGRALRDEEGRVFYVVERSDGKGYYSSPTRHGSEKDEQRYREMHEKTTVLSDRARHNVKTAVHDATGKGRPRSKLRVALLVILLLIAAALVYVYVIQPRLNAPEESDQNAAQQFSLFSPSQAYAADDAEPIDTSTQNAEGYNVTPEGLKYKTLEPGTGDGEIATAGRFVVIDYVASLMDGPVVDSTQESGPVGFVLWTGQVIRGWDLGIAGMEVGESRELIIPPHLVHTPTARETNLPNATLRCRITLLDVRPGVDWVVDKPGDGRIARPGDVVEVNYVGYVDEATEPFHSSAGESPLRFQIGAGEVITGWELGVPFMAEGERRTLIIPPYLAYGQRGFGSIIPPGATLRYQIELVRVVEP